MPFPSPPPAPSHQTRDPICDPLPRPPRADPPPPRPRGLFVPVLTPFRDDLSADPCRFADHSRWLLDRGASGLAVFGTTSEANSLAVHEKIDLLYGLIDAGIDPGCLMPGTGACALTDTIRLTTAAVETNCAGVLMLPPFYYKGVSDDGLFESYRRVIETVADDRLRVYLYHFPQMSQTPLSVDLIRRLIDAYPKTVVGLKDSSGDWDHTRTLLETFPGFDVFPGSEARLLDALRLGAPGCISATANLNPDGIAAVITGWQTPEAEALQDRAAAVRAAVQGLPMIPALKAVLAQARSDPAWQRVRPPLMPLDVDTGAALTARLAALGVNAGDTMPPASAPD